MVLIEEIDSPKASEHKDRGNSCFAKGDYDEAVLAFTEGIRKIDDGSLTDPSILYSNRCMAQIKKESWIDALQDANRAIKLNTKNGKAFYRKGQALVALRRYEEAEEALSSAVKVCSGIGNLKSLVPTIEETLRECRAKRDPPPTINKPRESPSKVVQNKQTHNTGVDSEQSEVTSKKTPQTASVSDVVDGTIKARGKLQDPVLKKKGTSQEQSSQPSPTASWARLGKEYHLELTELVEADCKDAEAVTKNVDVELGKTDVKITCRGRGSTVHIHPIPSGADVLLGATAKWLQKRQKLVVTLRAKRC